MNELGRLVADILCQLTLAQHKANKLSGRLARLYAKDPTLRFLPVPNAAINSFEIALRFALEEVVDQRGAGDDERISTAIGSWWQDLVDQLKARAVLSTPLATALAREGPPTSRLSRTGSEGGPLQPVLRDAQARLAEVVVPTFPLSEVVEGSRMALAQRILEALTAEIERPPGSSLDAVFDMTRLGGIDEGLVCEIRLAVDMRSYAAGTLYSTDRHPPREDVTVLGAHS